MNSEVASEYFSARELAELRLTGFPSSSRAFKDLADRSGWQYRDAPSRGRWGTRREYQPPAEVMALIRARQAGDLPAPAPRRSRPKMEVQAGAQPEEEGLEIKPPRIGGAALKCPQCGSFTGLIKSEGRVRLEFDAPGPIPLLSLYSVINHADNENRDEVFALAIRAYSVLSLITAGNEEAIDRYLKNDALVASLLALAAELQATSTHAHDSAGQADQDTR